MLLTDRVTVNGEQITRRVHLLILDAFKAAGIDPSKCYVNQGSWSNAGTSAGTHAGGGAFDLRTWNLPADRIVPLVVELRRRNVCAWYRAPQYGWTASGPHIHGIVRDEPGLAAGAATQVRAYDNKQNGLAGGGADYHPRPIQKPFVVSKWTKVIAPRTGVYTRPSSTSTRVAWRYFGFSVEYIGVVLGTDGKKWLVTPSGNHILAARTALAL